MKKYKKLIFKIIIYLFAAFGFGVLVIYFATKYGFTNDSGIVDKNDRYFKELANIDSEFAKKKNSAKAGDSIYQEMMADAYVYAKITAISKRSPKNGALIKKAWELSRNRLYIDKMFKAADIYLKDDAAYQFEIKKADRILKEINGYRTWYLAKWMNTDEWEILKETLKKEKPFIDKAAKAAGIESRYIVCVVIGEQIRIFNQFREDFKNLFAPAKKMKLMKHLSFGVTGVKEYTAIAVEENLKNDTSIFYLGKKYENLLDYNVKNPINERIARLTNEKDHYYSYLYAALIIRQTMVQWKKANCDISDRPEILASLYNLGFKASKPKKDPRTGGTDFDIIDETYSFGGVVFDFYYSGELFEEYPALNKHWEE